MITLSADFKLVRTISPVAADDDWVANQAIDVETLDTTGFQEIRVKAIATTEGGKGAAGACTVQVVSLADGVVADVGGYSASYGTTRAVTLGGADVVAVRMANPTGLPDKVQILVKGVA